MVIMNKSLTLTPAVVRAAALARKSGDKLLAALFEFDRAMAHAALHGFDLNAYKRGRREKLESLAERLRHDGLTVETRLFWNQPVLARMLLAILARQPQMVVKDVHEQGALKRILFAPEDIDLLRQCPAPLMLVRGGAHGLPRRILAAVDPLDENGRPHELDARVLNAANRIAMQCDAELDVVHAFEYVPPLAVPGLLTGAMPNMGLTEQFRAMHLAALRSWGKRLAFRRGGCTCWMAIPVRRSRGSQVKTEST
jgi:universal stress protein E